MAKSLSPVCKLCRREGEKLYLKGERCFTPKCSFEKRSFAPGQHGRTASRGGPNMGRSSDFARQLRAKQKARRIYGVLERQFRRYYDTAITRRGLTGLNLLQILESRLDNVVYRLGFAASRAQARVLVTHGHFIVNGRRTDVPSMLLSEGDAVAVREGSGKLTYFKELGAFAEKRNTPAWLSRDLKSMSGSVARMPERAEIDGSLDEQLIVEYYSRR
ncbi:MAG: 30S ribosomal protein S4 [Anaerolineaceae bacterium]|jgi:small subunit ribosomal protein S4|nr:MAG: 30S ribosomal protein S4 [Anaerolineaceae bacterium]